MNNTNYIVVMEIGIVEVFYFNNIDELLEYFEVNDLEELKKDKYLQGIYEIKRVLYE